MPKEFDDCVKAMKKAGKSEDSSYAICISNYIRSKGIGELVESFSSKGFESLSLTIFGNIYEPSFFDELNRVKTSNIILNHAISRETLAETLEKFDCLILPSWNEAR